MTASFYNFKNMIEELKKMKKLGANLLVIMSFHAFISDTRFGVAEEFIEEIEKITENKIICDIQEAEKIGLEKRTDILVVAPATRKHHCKTC